MLMTGAERGAACRPLGSAPCRNAPAARQRRATPAAIVPTSEDRKAKFHGDRDILGRSDRETYKSPLALGRPKTYHPDMAPRQSRYEYQAQAARSPTYAAPRSAPVGMAALEYPMASPKRTWLARVNPLRKDQQIRATRLTIVVLGVVLGLTVGCGSVVSSSSRSCTGPVTFRGQVYRYPGAVNSFQVSGQIGTFTYPPCEDTGRSDTTLSPADRTTAIFRVVGLDPNDGIAVKTGGRRDGFRLLGRSTETGNEPGFTPAFAAFIANHNLDSNSKPHGTTNEVS